MPVPPPTTSATLFSRVAIRSRLQAELAAADLDRNRAQVLHGVGEVAREPVEDLLALLGRGPQRVADHAVIGKLVVVHRKVEVLVTLVLRIPRAIGLAERLGKPV